MRRRQGLPSPSQAPRGARHRPPRFALPPFLFSCRKNAFFISLRSSSLLDCLEPLTEEIEHRHSVLDCVALELPMKGRGHLEVERLEACRLWLLQVTDGLLDRRRWPLLRAFRRQNLSHQATSASWWAVTRSAMAWAS